MKVNIYNIKEIICVSRPTSSTIQIITKGGRDSTIKYNDCQECTADYNTLCNCIDDYRETARI